MNSNVAPEAMVVTPHHLATQSAIEILKQGGTAIEATVAAAATLAVVCPHLSSIGGDGFWLLIPPNCPPLVIEACGYAGSLANLEFFKDVKRIPDKGPKAASTVAGAIAGWQDALKYNAECGFINLPLANLLDDAIRYAENGFTVTKDHYKFLHDVNRDVSKGFNDVFSPEGNIPKIGQKCCQQKLANTLKELAEKGLSSFYKADLAKLIAEDMETLGMPITETDLVNYSPIRKTPLRLFHSHGEILNSPPPTQGLVSLAVLGILDKLGIDGKHDGELIHAAVEATKQGFILRDGYITDPKYMSVDPESLITDQKLMEYAKRICLNKASPFGKGKGPGDTVWIGVMDSNGFSVSYIQSLYFIFGSGVVLPQTGILWHNRGVAFNLVKDHMLCVKPGKLPFHTLNPAAARLKDGRLMVYGTCGGDGQSQTQAAIFHRYAVQGKDLQESVTAPRWLFGRILGDVVDTLKVEARFSDETVEHLKTRGHEVVVIPEYSNIVGTAGALVRHVDGMLEGAFDVRGNGSAAGF